ncbi:MAG: hypothetical protein AAFZ05_05765, partial [Pseudomonadota bacterium]
EPRHRLGLITPELKERILRARKSIRRHLPEICRDQIEFYDAKHVITSAPIRDNLLFGRTAQNTANAEQRIAEFLRKSLPKLGLDDLIYSLGLDYDVGPGGRNLFAEQRAAVSLARSLIRHPDMLILEEAFSAFGRDRKAQLIDNIRADYAGKTVVVTFGADETPEGFDQVVTFDGPRAMLKTDTSSTSQSRDDSDPDADDRADDDLVTTDGTEAALAMKAETS